MSPDVEGPDPGWRELPPLQRTLADPLEPVAPLGSFVSSLAAYTDPSFLAPLTHQVDPSGGGVADGLASLAPGQPRARADLADLSVPPRADVGHAAPRVQRQPAGWASVTEPSTAVRVPERQRRVEAVTDRAPREGLLPDVALLDLPVVTPVSNATPAPDPVSTLEPRPDRGLDLASVDEPGSGVDPAVGQAPLSGFAQAISAFTWTDRSPEDDGEPAAADQRPVPSPTAIRPLGPAVQPTVARDPAHEGLAPSHVTGSASTESASTESVFSDSMLRSAVSQHAPAPGPAPDLAELPVVWGSSVNATVWRPSFASAATSPAPMMQTLGLLSDRPLPVQRQTGAPSPSIPEPVQRPTFLLPGQNELIQAARQPAGPTPPARSPTTVQRAGDQPDRGFALAVAPAATPGSRLDAPLTDGPGAREFVPDRLAEPLVIAQGWTDEAATSRPGTPGLTAASNRPARPDVGAPVQMSSVQRRLESVEAWAPTRDALPASGPTVTGIRPTPSSGTGGSGRPPVAVAPPVVLRQRAATSVPAAGGTSFTAMFGSRAGSASPASDDTSVQLLPDDAMPDSSDPAGTAPAGGQPGSGVVPSTPADLSSGTPAAAAPVAAAATPAASTADLEELARRLYEPLSTRLRAELWLDRERSGLMTDAR